MLTSSLTQFIRRIGVCAFALAAGVSAAIAFLLLVSGPPAHAQAADGPHPVPNTARAESLPVGASAGWQAAVKEQLAQDGSIGPTSLDPSHVVTLTGELPNTSFGVSVATAGDVNGDGYADVIVGASGYSTATGRIYVYHGTANGLTTSPALTITGEITASRFGSSLGTAGDVNGDGYSDVVIGAWGFSANAGRAYVYLGSATGLNSTPAFKATGPSYGIGVNLGWAVGTAGDVNNDGYDDVIIGVPFVQDPIKGDGQAYVYLGTAGGLSATPVFTANGEVGGNHSFFGSSVGTAGDVNGDGYADIIIGAYLYNDHTGRAYVYLGNASGLNSTPAFVATGKAVNNNFGLSLGTAGDVNEDGYDDVIIGEPGSISYTGRVYMYLGSATGLSATPAFTLTGEATNNGFGGSVKTAGDVNGDGYAEVIIGASGYDSRGRAYVYSGSAVGLNTTPIFTATGEATGNSFGAAVATGGDVDGDSNSDIVIGAFGYNNSTGRAYVYLSSPDVFFKSYLPLITK